jgi:hypothetical protein
MSTDTKASARTRLVNGRWSTDARNDPASRQVRIKTTDVEVHQTVRDLKGDVLSDKMVARRTIT